MAKFKVGDRVRRIKRSNGDGMDVGTEWVVAGFKKYLSDDYLVFEGGRDGNAENFEPVAVAPATATLTIEAGKFYKTRDGRKVGPLIVQDDDEFPFLDDAACESDRPDGTWGFNQKIESRNDLIAEWVDGPDAYAPITVNLDLEFIPFPQVGDAVLIPGVISAINQSPRGTNYNIVFETQNRRMSLHFLEDDFILDEGECVCANNDNDPVRTGDTAKAFDALANSIFGLTVRRAA